MKNTVRVARRCTTPNTINVTYKPPDINIFGLDMIRKEFLSIQDPIFLRCHQEATKM